MSRFKEVLSTHFPNAMLQSDFVARSHKALQEYGFRPHNSFCLVGVCRDEITLPLVEDIKSTWGEVFTCSSLAGMLFLGKTGFLAAQHHAPNEDGRERHVYFALPHIAIDAQGEIGRHDRPGRLQPSYACGALHGFLQELASGTVKLALDNDDLEQSLLKQQLFRRLTFGEVPDLITLTRIAQAVILEELERMIQLTVDPNKSDYAVLNGIQIHGPEAQDFVWPAQVYSVIGGKRMNLHLHQTPIPAQ